MEKDYKYYTAICLLIKDENDYFPEWLRWHIKLGIQHFYVYDNNSKVPMTETVKRKLPYELREYVTVVDWGGKHRDIQADAYRDCLKKFSKDIYWLGFIDTDEFIQLNGKYKDYNINDFLKNYEDNNALYYGWKVFNANGKVKREYGKSVVETFTQTTENYEKLGKLFVKAKLTKDCFVHEAVFYDDGIVVDEHKKTVPCMCYLFTNDYIQCNHYYTKSWEEWQNKIMRGTASPVFGRKLTDFFLYNPDLIYLNKFGDVMQQYY